MDLIPVLAADVGPEPTATETESSPSAISIPQNPEKSNSKFVENEKKGQAVVEDSGAGKVPGAMGVRQSAQWKAAVNLMEMLSRTTGTKFVGFDGASWDEGHYDPKTRTAYINRNSDRPFSWIVFHEFGHDLRVNDRAAPGRTLPRFSGDVFVHR